MYVAYTAQNKYFILNAIKLPVFATVAFKTVWYKNN